MPVNKKKIKSLLDGHRFKDLFIEELGWDDSSIALPLEIGSERFDLKSVAHKKGFTAFVCPRIPESSTRAKIENKVAKNIREHLIIYAENGRQRWQWVRRVPGRPLARREHEYNPAQPMLLVEKIGYMEVSLDEEETVDIIDVYDKVRSAMDVDRVTKRFYDRFKKEQEAFQSFIRGIGEQGDKKWYCSVMLNRLMFIYFIQKKGFLDNDVDYLRNRLAAVQKKKGQGKFHTFYRYFLMKLCHEALGKIQRERRLDPDLIKLIGNVPYLNGGIFQPHDLEIKYADIDIADEAFERIFDFFDQFEWHLDSRPNAAENEINPEVLGYIFEKYINQKQMGAYYTKEDITEYISKNTIIPSLFDKAKEKCSIAFEGDPSLWNLLKEDPDRYIYPAVRHGVSYDMHNDVEIKNPVPYPDEIAVGLDTASPNLLERRKHWNTKAPPEAALPTEIWREVVARRQRYEELKNKLASGEVRSINDLITLNLDIRQFAQDVIERCESPDLLNAFWVAIAGRIPQQSNEEMKAGISILDPTCGSGAFLFAALKILEPLYEACLDKMQEFLNEWEEAENSAAHRNYARFFKSIRDEIGKHPTPKYYIYKSIIINNLYGVDIMREAVEICKLRLFLKLVAHVENASRIEPLPDIDFNIRSGNTLVGFATEKEMSRAMEDDLIARSTVLPEIIKKANEIDRLYKLFRQAQLDNDESVNKAKEKLSSKLRSLEDELNKYLADDYGVNTKKEKEYKKFLESHQPFHWFIEFYGIMKSGGFDTIIGNPPYVSTNKIEYFINKSNFKSLAGKNLYSLVMEQALNLSKEYGHFGMIVPVSIMAGDGFVNVADKFFNLWSWVSSFSNRPGKLFYGVEQRLTIIITKNCKGILFTTEYQHWYESERINLFPILSHAPGQLIVGRIMPLKIGLPISSSIARKVYQQQQCLKNLMGHSQQACWFHDGPTYWIRALPFQPSGNDSSRSSHYHKLDGENQEAGLLITGILISSIFYFHFKLTSNCRDFGIREINIFRFPKLPVRCIKLIVELVHGLGLTLQQTAKKCCREYNSGLVEYDEYYPAKAKPIIDEIDKVLAGHYGFTEEELDFIINYDIKYRMGAELEEDIEQ